MNPKDVVWKKSLYSASGNCVEVAHVEAGKIAVRDSKDQDGPILIFTDAEWKAFVNGVKSGEFDQ